MSEMKVFEGFSSTGSIQDAIVEAVNKAKIVANPDEAFPWELVSIKGRGNSNFAGVMDVAVVIHAAASKET